MKFNHNFGLLFAVVVSMGLVSSCTDLEVKELDTDFSSIQGGASLTDVPNELLNTAYNKLDMFADQANCYALYEHVTDEMIPPTRGTDWGDNGVWRSLHAHNWDASHSMVLATWNQLNERAFNCTQVIQSSPTAQTAAEAKFLRGFYTSYLLDLFGQVPFRNATDKSSVVPSVRTRTEAFNDVIKDLEEALPLMPAKGPDATNARASKATVNALLCRMYLNKAVYTAANPAGPYTHNNADLDKAITYADAVTADGFDLEDDYFTNFTTNASKEIIFVSPTGGPLNRVGMTTHYDQKYPSYGFADGGWNGFTTLGEFYDKFEAGDERRGSVPNNDLGRGFLLGQQYQLDGSMIQNSRNGKPLSFTREVKLAGAQTDEGIRVIKYHPKDMGKYILMRYAEVYLNKAEAMMRKGDTPGALAMVNALRAKRGATALATINEAGMLDERGRELYWEGLRRIDQIRFGTFNGTWNSKSNTEAFRVLFPIPQLALDSNPNLKQNDGY